MPKFIPIPKNRPAPMPKKPKRKREKPLIFTLEIKDESVKGDAFKNRLMLVSDAFNASCSKSEISKMMYLDPQVIQMINGDYVTTGLNYKIYIDLNDTMEGVSRDYFSAPAYKGYKFFSDQEFRVVNSSHYGCQVKFSKWKRSGLWSLDVEADEQPDWLKEKDADALKEVDLSTITEFTDNN